MLCLVVTAFGECPSEAAAEYAVSEHHARFETGGVTASYVRYAPDTVKVGHQLRVVVALYWAGGSMQKSNFAQPEFKDLRSELCRRGYAVVVPELGPTHFMDAAAVKKLDAVLTHLARDRRFDTSRVFLFGTGMGGASAFTYLIQRPDRVAAVVSHMGITDYTSWASSTSKFRKSLWQSFGGSPQQCPDEYRARSAMFHVNALVDHRIYFIHGDADKLVDLSQSVLLHKELLARHGKSQLTIVPGGKHANATIAGVADEVANFFDEDEVTDPVWPTTQELAASMEWKVTKDGQRYAILPSRSKGPSPTLFILSGAAEQSLTDPYFLQCGKELRRKGFLCVSMDLPCHGKEVHAGEPEGLPGWNARVNAGEPYVQDFCTRFRRVLTDLIDSKLADPARIAICGTSRGGFLAFHAAACDPRVRAIVGMAPVTSLLALDEFRDSQARDDADRLALRHLVPRLADRKVWIAIGDRDERVGTDEAIRFARLLSAQSLAKNLPPCVDLLVLAEPRGHSLPRGTDKIAAEWLSRVFSAKPSTSAN